MRHDSTYQRMHRTNADERRRLIDQFRHSGLSRREFAHKHGFSIYTLHRWLAQAGNAGSENQSIQFSEVKLLPSFSSIAWAMEVVSPSGVSIRFRDLPLPEELGRVLRGIAC